MAHRESIFKHGNDKEFTNLISELCLNLTKVNCTRPSKKHLQRKRFKIEKNALFMRVVAFLRFY